MRAGLDFPVELVEQRAHRRAVITHRQHIATGLERGPGALDDIAELPGAAHGKIVGEDRAFETQLLAQRALDPAA
jgi:hypothetical protein